jgi:hypothetical protein
MNRRNALRNGGLALLSLVAALAPSRHARGGESKTSAVPATVEGTWTLTVTPTPGPGAPPPFPALATFTSNGGLIVTDSTVTGVGQGTWVQTGDRAYLFTFVRLLYDSAGHFAGSHKVRQVVAVNETYDTWSGPAKIQLFDPTGKELFSGTSSVQATRLRAEPIQ